MLSEKYIAGFLDADGSIQVAWRRVDRADSNKELKRAYLSLEFGQLEKQDEVLQQIQQVIGGTIDSTNKLGVVRLRLFGKEAVMVLNRIKKHLVIMRHYADAVLDVVNKVHNRNEMQKLLKQQRRIKSLPLPNYPSRQWLAGYFDGDGCIHARLPKSRNAAQIAVEIVSTAYDSEGLEILQKAFGGSLNTVTKNLEPLTKWTLTMPPSKAKEFLGHFQKHSINKREQALFILGCAEMGNYRDGKSIKAIMKQLKTQPHRLSEPKLDVSELVDTVKCIDLKDTYKDRDYWPPERRAKRQSANA